MICNLASDLATQQLTWVVRDLSTGRYIQGVQAHQVAQAMRQLAHNAGAKPDIVIDRRIQATEEDISKSLPSTIDLINICIRSGMNLERAIARVAEEATGPLEIDLNTVAERASLGDSIEDAVKTLAANQEISIATSTFLSTIARATRLGVPLGQVIQQTADDMRKRQIDVVKTSAAKLPVKILMPLMLLLLPAVLLVVLGPAVLSLVDGLSSL